MGSALVVFLLGGAAGVTLAWLIVEASDFLAGRYPPDRRRRWRRRRSEW